jgi:predicted transcriptional regulator
MSKHILRKHLSNFTIVSNNIIKILKHDLSSLGFYLHIVSLPDNWVFYKTALAKECGIGINKLEKILKKLKSVGLIEYGQKRNTNGRFSEFYLDVYDLETLKINDIAPDVKNHRTVKTVAPFQEAIQETYTKKERSKDNKEKRERDKKRPPALTSVPIDFNPTQKHALLAIKQNVDLEKEKEAFIDYYEANGKKMANWNAAFNSWLRKSSEFNKKYQAKEHPVTASIRQLKEKSSEFRNFLLS